MFEKVKNFWEVWAIFRRICCLVSLAIANVNYAQDASVPLPPDRPNNLSLRMDPNLVQNPSADVSGSWLPAPRPKDTPNRANSLFNEDMQMASQSSSGSSIHAISNLPPSMTPPVLPPGCFDQLKALNVIFVEFPDFNGTGQCGLTNSVEVSGFDGIRLRPPAPMTCQMAISMAIWMRDSVIPEARDRFDQNVAEINQISTYACRARPSGRLSEHAFGNAMDVSGFRLADKTLISVESDWHNRGRKGSFMRAVAKESCQYFSAVLTPLSDVNHQDHLHLDKGVWLSCGA